MSDTRQREQGMGRGKIYPARHAGQLRHPLRALLQSPRRLVGNLPIPEDGWVLELGCGPGHFSPTLAAAAPQGRLQLFDFQRPMLAMARERLHEVGKSNFDCVQGDGMALPYRSTRFDLALLVTVLGEIPDPAACLREVWRALKPGGHLAISEGRNDADFHPVGAIRSLAEPVGFHFVRRHGPAWNYTAVFQKPG